MSLSIGGRSYPSSSVGEILKSTALAYPPAKPFPIGGSLMRAILSPQEAADLLFYLMNVMSTVSVSTTTPSTRTTCCSTGAASIYDMDPEQRTRLRNAIETAISKGRQRKSEARKNMKSGSKRSKKG